MENIISLSGSRMSQRLMADYFVFYIFPVRL
nr:MAG TPA: hypothetical protein [Caudoviricetes sp.]